MGQLPSLIEQTAELRDRSDFQVVTVSHDIPDRQSELDRVIREYGIEHTVIWDHREATDLSNKADWNIKGFPTTVLINPAGTIQTSMSVDEHLAENLRFFMDSANVIPAIGLSIVPVRDADGKVRPDANGEITVALDLYSPTHDPLEASISLSGGSMPGQEGEESPSLLATFNEFGSSYLEFQVAITPESRYVFVSVSIPIAGTEALNDGAGLSTSSFSFVMLDMEEATE